MYFFEILIHLLSLHQQNTVGIAQLVRASVCGTEGRRFEPDYLPTKEAVSK